MTRRAPHEIAVPGPAASFAATLSGMLPEIETARLRLRAPRLSDFDAWAEILTGPAAPYLGGPFDRDDAFMEFLASCGTWLLRGHGPWTVEPKAGGEVLGFVLLGFEPGDAEPELGYLFRPSAEGRGFATEAVTAARTHAFTALGLDRVVSYIAPENAASTRLARRVGAVQDGTHDGSQVWVHLPMPARQNADAKTSQREN
ncbi:GNAT family N-acetyltransferase [Tabrizicola sp.]|uniref:GNAT family N-acetyltransferase n=1 Tax=Tabrizicola sp. TaxID=2005166 RepID=UPI0025E8ACA2|nr:GNAT family N-acetyltransferase [Tabrizicola sp.]